MKIASCAFLVFVWAAVALSQDLTRPVTYTSRALPLRQVLADLSAQCGTKLSATDDMANEPLILGVDNTPAQDVIDKIAEAFQGDWIKTADGMRMQRSKERIAAIQTQALKDRTALIQSSVQALVEMEKQNGPIDDVSATALVKSFLDLAKSGRRVSDEEDFEMHSRLPLFRIGVQILASIDPAELASLPDQSQTVYATNPNPSQRAIPKFDLRYVSQLITDNSTLEEAYQKLVPVSQHDRISELSHLAEPPSKISVRIDAHNLGAYVYALDPEGKVLGRAIFGIDDVASRSHWERDYRQDQVDAAKSGFPLGADAEDLALGGTPTNDIRRPIPSSLIDKLCAPTKWDPLSFAPSDVMLAGAKQKGMNVIALLPDVAAIRALPRPPKVKLSLNLFRLQLGQPDVQTSESDGWIVWKPSDPVTLAQLRVPRTKIEALYSAVRSRGYVQIEDLATFLAGLADSFETRITLYNLRFMTTSGQRYGVYPGIVRLYGLLSEDERQAAAQNGFSTQLGNLTQEEQDDLYQYAMWSGAVMGDPDMGHPDFDISEQLPDGLPPTALVSLSVTSEDIPEAVLSTPDGTQDLETLDEDMLALCIAHARNPRRVSLEILSTASVPPDLSGLRYTKQRTLHFKLQVDHDHYFIADFVEPGRPTGPPMKPDDFLASMPEKERAEIEKQVEEMTRPPTR